MIKLVLQITATNCGNSIRICSYNVYNGK